MDVLHARERYARWLVVGRDLSLHTVRAYDADVAAFARHLGPGALVCDIDRACVVAFLEHQRAAGLSPASVRRRAAGIRGFCRWLVASELIVHDPSNGASVPASRSRRLPRIVPRHDLTRLLSFLQGQAGVCDAIEPLADAYQATTLLAVVLMLATGIRVGEAVRIRCRDIDLPARSVRIVGKGRRERHVFLPNDWIEDLTRAYFDMRATLDVNHGHLLVNSSGDPLTAAALRSRLIKAADAAGLRARVTPHMLRHTAATQLIEAGVDIRYIQRLLGHASLTTTEMYTHVSDVALKRVLSDADVLGRLAQRR